MGRAHEDFLPILPGRANAVRVPPRRAFYRLRKRMLPHGKGNERGRWSEKRMEVNAGARNNVGSRMAREDNQPSPRKESAPQAWDN